MILPALPAKEKEMTSGRDESGKISFLACWQGQTIKTGGKGHQLLIGGGFFLEPVPERLSLGGADLRVQLFQELSDLLRSKRFQEILGDAAGDGGLRVGKFGIGADENGL